MAGHDWTPPVLDRVPPTTFGLWYLIGRAGGAVAARGVNLVIDACEFVVKVRRRYHPR